MKIEYKQQDKPLSLKNGGKLEIIPIGVGSMLAGRHHNTNYLIVKGETHILLDCGRIILDALRDVGVEMTDIQTILPSHSHDDHVGGIGTLAIANRYIGQALLKKPKLQMIASLDFARALWENNLKGNLACNEPNSEFGNWFNLLVPYQVSAEHREASVIDFGGINIRMFRTMHVPATANSWKDSAYSIGFLVDGKVLISGDTRFDRELVDNYQGRCEAVFHDVTFFDDPVHASLESLRGLPVAVKEKIHLIHYGDSFEKHDVSGFAGFAMQGARYVFD